MKFLILLVTLRFYVFLTLPFIVTIGNEENETNQLNIIPKTLTGLESWLFQDTDTIRTANILLSVYYMTGCSLKGFLK